MSSRSHIEAIRQEPSRSAEPTPPSTRRLSCRIPDGQSCGRGVDLLAHSSAIEIDDILKDFSPHRAVRAHETDIYREDSIVENIPLAYIFLSSLMVELRFK